MMEYLIGALIGFVVLELLIEWRHYRAYKRHQKAMLTMINIVRECRAELQAAEEKYHAETKDKV